MIRPADKRCEVYSIDGDDISVTLASVLMKDPDWAAIPSSTSPGLLRLLSRCLKKDPKERLQAIGDARIEIDELLRVKSDTTAGVVSGQMPARRVAMTAIATLVVGGVLATMVTLSIARTATQPRRQPVRFTIVPPIAQPLLLTGSNRDLAVSPDGQYLVYVASDDTSGRRGAQLMVRALDQLEAVPLRGATGTRPFISPDSRWVGFYTAGGLLRKVPITGGPPITVCRVPGSLQGATWSENGDIILATSEASTGLLSVADAGGEPSVLTKPDLAHGEHDHVFPSALPGGRAVLFTITTGPGRAPEATEDTRLAVLDLKTRQTKTLIENGSHPEYVGAVSGSAQPGFVVFGTAEGLRGIRFDSVRLQALSDPVPLGEQVRLKANGAAEFSVSPGGTLVYIPGGAGTDGSRSLVWVDRHGREETINAPTRPYAVVRLSPDGNRVAVDIREQQNDIWIWNFARQTLTPLTFGHSDNNPVWTSDGRRIIFKSGRAGAANLFWQLADGSGTPERLLASPEGQTPKTVSPDGKRVVFTATNDQTSANDIHSLVLDGKPRTEPLIQTAFFKNDPSISPDGHWRGYESMEGRFQEVYVRPFPNVNDGQWQVSTAGGQQPQWGRDGRELFYLDRSGFLTVVQVETKPTFTYSKPNTLLDTRYYASNGPWTYDISPDGQRFLMVKDSGPRDPTATPASMIVVEHWFAELKQRVSIARGAPKPDD